MSEPAGEPDLRSVRAAVDAAIADLCDRELTGLDGDIDAAIRYSLAGGGKCLRGALVLGAYEAAGGRGDARALAAAVEVVHAYSLVHDDLPCMDDDDIRRGRPTVHRVHGGTVAAIAGLAMVPLAALCADAGARSLGLSLERRGAIAGELMRGVGAGGMIGGQLLDLEGEGIPLTVAELERTHRAKTGALIAASVRIGALAAGSPPPVIAALEGYGSAVGLAFQIADDVLDVTATTEELGKTAGRDRALNKSTYPGLMGVAEANERAQALAREACAVLAAAGLLTPVLEALARYMVARRS